MSKSARLYNPVPDGLPAQIWECLWRNPQFDAAFTALISGSATARASAEGELKGNVFSRAVIDAVTQGVVAPGIVKLRWPTLPDQLRAKFDSLVADLRETPIPIHPPPVSSPGSPVSVDDQRLLTKFLKLWDKYEIVGLPRIVLDERHRRESKTVAGSHVPRVAKYPLGAERQWATYLLKKKYERSPYRDHANALAAWEHLETESYRRFRGDRFSPKGIAEARRALSRQGKEFDKRITAVEVAIAKVYPDFAVFGPLTQTSGEPLR